MAVKIRLKRMGKVRQPFYRVVVVDSRKKRDGRVIEEIGKYHPKREPSFIEVESERAQYWLGVGAQPTEAVEAILKVTGDWQRFKGLPGAEGTLRTAEPKRDKTEIFNEALKDAASEPRTEAVTKKKTEKKPAKKAAAETAPEPVAEPVAGPVAEPAAEEAPVAPAEAPAAEATETAEVTEPTEPTEPAAPADAPAEAPAEAADEKPGA